MPFDMAEIKYNEKELEDLFGAPPDTGAVADEMIFSYDNDDKFGFGLTMYVDTYQLECDLILTYLRPIARKEYAFVFRIALASVYSIVKEEFSTLKISRGYVSLEVAGDRDDFIEIALRPNFSLSIKDTDSFDLGKCDKPLENDSLSLLLFFEFVSGQEVGVQTYKKTDSIGLTLTVSIIPLDNKCWLVLTYPEYQFPVFDIQLKGVEKIWCEENSLRIKQTSNPEIIQVDLFPVFYLNRLYLWHTPELLSEKVQKYKWIARNDPK